MKIIRYEDQNNQVQVGVVDTANVAWKASGSLSAGFSPTEERADVLRLLAPIVPCNIFCIGLNYQAHAEETGATLPEHPVLFMKNSAALNHPDSDVLIPQNCQQPPQVDYEVELAVVIGRDALNVPTSEALNFVFGYTIANDISARRWQKQGGGRQWIRGKSFDGFCPIGPCIVTADELPDPQVLDLSLELNGEVMQTSNTSDMIFPVAEIISQLSQGMTLVAGSIILTGTPSGVGFTRQPPVFLQHEDQLSLNIPQIGELRNRIVYE